jgi:sugar phosphate isomerase/epimerase
MKLKLACADFAFPLLPHDNALDLIAVLGFDGVDIGLFEGRSHLWPSKVFKNIPSAARTLSAKIKNRGLMVADVFLQPAANFAELAINHPDARRRRKARECFLQTLEFAARCGASHVSALPGVHSSDEPAPAAFDRCCEELSWRIDQARRHGVVFSVEAHVGSIIPTPKDAERLLKATPGLTLTLDYTHFTREGTPDSEIEPLLKWASHFHARGGCQGRLQCSVKSNTIDYARVLRKMARTRYTGYVGVEYVWIDWEHCNEVDNLSETILLRDFLRKHAP